jgi:hypothetical protein
VAQEVKARYKRQKAREELRTARLRLRAVPLSLLEELAAKQRDLQSERLSVVCGRTAVCAAHSGRGTGARAESSQRPGPAHTG